MSACATTGPQTSHTNAATAKNDRISGPLVVSTAGSMGPVFKQLLDEFVKLHPGVVPTLRTGGSVVGARLIADSAPPPDVFVSADHAVIQTLLVPNYATWYTKFAYSSMVLAYTSHSHYASELSSSNWPQILLRNDVHAVRGDPNGDPGAYRTLMVFDLAGRAAHDTTLAARLTQAVPVTAMTATGLSAMFDSGGVDYMFMYPPSAAAHHLQWIALSPDVDLSDFNRRSLYRQAQVRIPSGVPGVPDTVTIDGAPVTYGLTTPAHAPHPAVALAFTRFALGVEGCKALRDAGFKILDPPAWNGDGPRDLGISVAIDRGTSGVCRR